jgi:hypothetical protein
MNAPRAVAVSLVVAGLSFGAVACSSSDTGSEGAVTNLDEVGPELARLRLEVEHLREEVRALREKIATPPTTTTTTTRPPG